MKQICQLEACLVCPNEKHKQGIPSSKPRSAIHRDRPPPPHAALTRKCVHCACRHSVCSVHAHTHTRAMHSCNQRNTSCFPVAAAAGLNHLPTSNEFLYWHACGVFPAKRDFASGDLPSLYIAARRGQWNKNAPTGDNLWEGVVRSLNSDSRPKVKLKEWNTPSGTVKPIIGWFLIMLDYINVGCWSDQICFVIS